MLGRVHTSCGRGIQHGVRCMSVHHFRCELGPNFMAEFAPESDQKMHRTLLQSLDWSPERRFRSCVISGADWNPECGFGPPPEAGVPAERCFIMAQGAIDESVFLWFPWYAV